ncbi:MAG: hypothetical protein NT155_00020 [Candidatus Staskawiczbacteria bacterium]|nr:hypothetical protein [Candidatus Staskawiczbacteria bacterium]
MDIKKCDFCKKEIFESPVTAGRGFFTGIRVELCDDCGEPILKFLRKHKLIDKNNKRIEES